MTQGMFWLDRLATTALVLLGAVLIDPHAASAANNYDRNWVGPTTVAVNGSGAWVPWVMGATLRIIDGKFNQEVGGAPMQSAIAPDGSFNASGRRQIRHETLTVQFVGRIAGGQLNAVWQSKYCTMNMALHRQ